MYVRAHRTHAHRHGAASDMVSTRDNHGAARTHRATTPRAQTRRLPLPLARHMIISRNARRTLARISSLRATLIDIGYQ